MGQARDLEIQNGVLKKYTGAGGDVVIPEGVQVIDHFAFYECSGLTGVRLPESVTAIGNWAFRECGNLRRVTGGDRVQKIGNSAFYGCSSLTDITLPAGLTEVGNAVFYGCRKLRGIRIPEGVTAIGRSAFAWCTGLTRITVPERVQTIGNSAFSYCTGLTHISMLGSVEWIGEGAFAHSDALSVLYAPRISMSQWKAQKLEMPGIMGYIQNSADYRSPQIAAGYQKYLFSNRKTLLPLIFGQDLAQVLELFARAGKITARDFDAWFMEPAQKANATQCVAFLLDWRGKHLPEGYAQRQLLRELEKDPFCITDMKKLWDYEPGNGTLTITGYKGGEAEVEIPPRIGALPVTAIGAEAFSTEKRGRRQSRREVLERLTAVTVPDSVTQIGADAFRGCKALTLRGSAGSCAEAYAEANRIPFQINRR